MEFSSPYLWLVAGLGVVYSLRVIFKAFGTPLRHVPGPFLARFTRLWLLNEVYRGTYPRTSVQLHKKYGELVCLAASLLQQSDDVAGPVVRIAPNEYSIDDPAAAKLIYGSGRGFVKVRDTNIAFALPRRLSAMLLTSAIPVRVVPRQCKSKHLSTKYLR